MRINEVMRVCFVMVILLIPISASLGREPNLPVFTRWMDPSGRPEPQHVPLQPAGPLHLEKVALLEEGATVFSGTTSGRICLVVHESVFSAIDSKLVRYESDLVAMGYSVETNVYSSGPAEELRSYLLELYEEPESLVGAVLIGDIPYVIYEMMADYGMGTQYDDFPSDIFFMDLDGTWSDDLNDGQVRAGNGKYDTRSGNLDLEIWTCRMKTDNLPSLGLETDILNDYFDKNHRYRTGELQPERKALVYNDDDWAEFVSIDASNVRRIYDPSRVTVVSDPEATTGEDYKGNRMTANFEFMILRSHGTPMMHGFYRNHKMSFDYIFPGDYLAADPKALFYSLFVCSGGDYTANDYLAGTVAFNRDDSGLLAWSSTKTGGMCEETSFYLALADGAEIGEAFRRWFNQVQRDFPVYAPSWWYGMTLLGDAALKPLGIAGFKAEPLSGPAPLTVSFTDLSRGNVDSWSWDFGDGGTSFERDPEYTYNVPGVYSVTLTVDGAGGHDTKTRTDYIVVDEASDLSVFRYESVASLASRLPETIFSISGLPWLDPDDVLDPGAPPLFFYRLSREEVMIHVVKEAATVRIESM